MDYKAIKMAGHGNRIEIECNEADDVRIDRSGDAWTIHIKGPRGERGKVTLRPPADFVHMPISMQRFLAEQALPQRSEPAKPAKAAEKEEDTTGQKCWECQKGEMKPRATIMHQDRWVSAHQCTYCEGLYDIREINTVDASDMDSIF